MSWRHSVRPARRPTRQDTVPLIDDPVAHIPAVVWLAQPGDADRRFTVRYVNDAGRSLLGYP